MIKWHNYAYIRMTEFTQFEFELEGLISQDSDRKMFGIYNLRKRYI